MSFAGTLPLSHFVQRLPLRAPQHIVAVEGRLGRERDVVEHEPIGEIAVVPDGQQPPARFFLVVGHPLPQVLGIDAVVLRVGHDLIGFVLGVAKDDYSMQIVARGRRRPLVADQRGEVTRVVVFFGCSGDALPRRARHRHPLEGILARKHGRTPCVVRLRALAALDEFNHLAAELGREEIRVRFGDHRRQAQVFRVIRDNQEIQRPTEPRGQSAAGLHGLAAREAIRFLRSETITEHAGVGRIAGVQVGIAKKHPVRESLLRVR